MTREEEITGLVRYVFKTWKMYPRRWRRLDNRLLGVYIITCWKQVKDYWPSRNEILGPKM